MRILFAGSPAIAVPSLEAVAAMSGEGFILAGLLTSADAPRGRSGKPEPAECASALAALEARRLIANPIPLLKPEKLDRNAREQAAALNAELLVSFAYGKIFGPQFLALFPFGGINIHPSLLPQYRGPAPIPAAILDREKVTGVTIQRLAVKMDSGDILLQETVPLNGRETAASLSDIMAEKAAGLLPAALKGIARGTLTARPQEHASATYCSLIKKEDGLIDWSRSAAEIDARIRAFDPWPLSWTTHGRLQLFIRKAEALITNNTSAPPGQVLGKDKDKGIIIQTGVGVLAVSELQYQARKAQEWKVFLHGARNFMGAKLGNIK